ncbi:alpha/beta fold hydrolase [Isoptericola sediminis]|uniref:Alpha/beta hydrolase n=1 Tax=Isoptericola sediminis TaxID=2733572 RepID=A0A849K4M8_9MICO|nr:alpha/beta hydrolase [Isoptericola sediminis]NNU26107.1 alpha/beta hydrolase [Isoptericola sediminis]
MSDAADYSCALVDGPWRHEFVAANGSRFHVAVAGPRPTNGDRDPLVVLLHGFPQFWWAWRHQIAALADAGMQVAALDVRGVAASDKPPSGRDVPTRTRDVAGVIRSVGHDRAVVVGAGTGGALAWAMSALQPAVTAAVAAVSAPHPGRLHVPGRGILTPAARRLFAAAQLPGVLERRLQDADGVAGILDAGSDRPLDPEAVARYREALRVPFAAHNTVDALRWLSRTSSHPAGRRYLAALKRPVDVPVLQLHGAADGFLRRETADLDGAALARDFRFEVVEGAGHFLPEEAPDAVTVLLLDWLRRPGVLR